MGPDAVEMGMTKPRETYDIAATAAQWGAALDRLRAEQRPGVKSGRGGKAAVLRAVRERLQALAGDGYTAGQIADALHEVSPRMVRAALREAAKPTKRRAARRTRAGTTGSGDSPPTGSAQQTAPDGAMPAGRSDVPISDAPPPRTEATATSNASTCADATPSTAGPAANVNLTPELRAQHRIPDWADGSDLRPGETLERYATRKRVAGPPKGEEELRKFIGEGRRRDP